MVSPFPRGRLVAALLAGAVLHAPSSAQTSRSDAAHIVRRMEFGASIAEVDALIGPTLNFHNYALAQLNPGVESGEAESLVKLYTNFPFTPVGPGSSPDLNVIPPVTQPAGLTIQELSEVNIALALTSSHQLREKLTQYWQKRLNTNYFKLRTVLQGAPFNLSATDAGRYAAHFEWEQNAGLRANALGDFRDLIEVSAGGAAMLIYLDGVSNHYNGMPQNPNAPNQNYGRELLELSTLGVDGWRLDPSTGMWVRGPTYTFQDLIAMSRVFSGFELVDTNPTGAPSYAVQFNGAKHFILDPIAGPQLITVFASTPLAPALTFMEDLSGPSEKTAVLDYLAAHPHTRLSVISDLWRLLIGGDAPDPNNPTIQSAFNAWGPRGNINAVLQVLVLSPEFLTTNRWTEARLPLEVVGQLYDGMAGNLHDPAAMPAANRAKLAQLRTAMSEYMGRDLFTFPSPDGFPFENDKQLTTMRLLGANRLRQELYSTFTPGSPSYPYVSGGIGYDTVGLLAAYGVSDTNPTAIADFLCRVLFADDHSTSDEFYVHDILLRDPSGAISATTLAMDKISAPAVYNQRLSRGFALAASLSLNNLK